MLADQEASSVWGGCKPWISDNLHETFTLILTDLGLVERNENNYHTDSLACNEPYDEKYSDIYRTGLQSGTEDRYQSGQIQSLLSTSRLAHPSRSQGAEDPTGREDAIDGPGNGIRVGVITAQTKLGDEAWLA